MSQDVPGEMAVCEEDTETGFVCRHCPFWTAIFDAKSSDEAWNTILLSWVEVRRFRLVLLVQKHRRKRNGHSRRSRVAGFVIVAEEDSLAACPRPFNLQSLHAFGIRDCEWKIASSIS